MTEIVSLPLDDGRAVTFEKVKLGRNEGYIYVVQFAGGVVKVGKSNDPRLRIRTYIQHARLYGGSVLNAWISPPHEAFGAMETLLIEYCAKRGQVACGREYFNGLEYGSVVAAAGRVNYQRTEQFYDVRTMPFAAAKEFIRQRRVRDAGPPVERKRSVVERVLEAMVPPDGANAVSA